MQTKNTTFFEAIDNNVFTTKLKESPTNANTIEILNEKIIVLRIHVLKLESDISEYEKSYQKLKELNTKLKISNGQIADVRITQLLVDLRVMEKQPFLSHSLSLFVPSNVLDDPLRDNIKDVLGQLKLLRNEKETTLTLIRKVETEIEQLKLNNERTDDNLKLDPDQSIDQPKSSSTGIASLVKSSAAAS